MKKLKLNLNDLKVDSFEIKNDIRQKGTIEGNISGVACSDTLNGEATCDCPSYVGTCIMSCYSCVLVTCYRNCTNVQCCTRDICS